MNGPTLSLAFAPRRGIVAGVDEAGRGPLAGPVVAAAVVLDRRRRIRGLDDSKKLSADERVRLAREIRRKAVAFAVGYAPPDEIDRINILQATLKAMERAVHRLRTTPDIVRVDGNQLPRFEGCAPRFVLEPVIGGDATVPAISAASILAKVCRDRLMRRWHRRYPVYGFDRHKGYATAVHLAALIEHGPCPIHRRSFAPCAPRGDDAPYGADAPHGAAARNGADAPNGAAAGTEDGSEWLVDDFVFSDD